MGLAKRPAMNSRRRSAGCLRALSFGVSLTALVGCSNTATDSGGVSSPNPSARGGAPSVPPPSTSAGNSSGGSGPSICVGCGAGGTPALAHGGASGGRDHGGAAGAASHAAFCSSSGPSLELPTVSGTTQCAGTVAQTAFRYAICSCADLLTSRAVTTDSFDSARGAYDPQQPGRFGSIGVNGDARIGTQGTPETLRAGGTLWLGGAQGIGRNPNVSNGMNVSAGDLKVRGAVQYAGDLSVESDARVAGDIDVNALSVNGTLRTSKQSTMKATAQRINARTIEQIDVAPPCSCEDDELVDIAGLVSASARQNDNQAAHFDPAPLANYAGTSRIELPCGRLYVPAVHGSGNLTLAVSGRSALFVGGDLEPGGELRVELTGPDAELDLFVEGTLISSARLELGSIARASRVRLYIGGSAPIFLSGGGSYAGNIYAPFAPFVISTKSEIYGSLFARGIVNSDLLTVHYDEAILRAGEPCAPPDDGCTSCLSCGNQACIAGECGACQSDADCCAPLHCEAGSCVAQEVPK